MTPQQAQQLNEVVNLSRALAAAVERNERRIEQVSEFVVRGLQDIDATLEDAIHHIRMARRERRQHHDAPDEGEGTTDTATPAAT